MNRLRLLLSASALWLAMAASAAASPGEIITKARAYLGSEAALDAVKSVRYMGTVDTVEKQEDGVEKPVSYGIEIIFQREYQQRITLTRDTSVVTTALDDYEAWHRVQDRNDASRWRTVLFQKSQVKQFRASSWQNLAFFKGIEHVGGRVEDNGVVQIDGKDAHKLSFVHEPGIVYVRYFDPGSGKLLFTETDQGVRIREEGEIVEAGIRFPRRITNITTAEGRERVVTITISEVTVNETFPDELFRVPLVPSK